jgi:hypothetical protein
MNCRGNAISTIPAVNHRNRASRCCFILLTGLLFIGTSIRAQEEFIASPTQFITSFNFRLLTGGIILAKGTLGNFKDSLNFIFDTGSGGISLDSTTCLRLHLVPEPSDRTIRGIAGIRKVKFIYNQTIHFPGLTVDSFNFHVSDYDILTSVYGERIDGIIGFSFLSRYIVKINYDSLKLSVYTRGSIKYPKGGFLLHPVLAGLPIQSARVRDAADIFSRFYFDTGAGLCLLLSSDFVSDSLLLSSKKKQPVYTQAQGLGGKADMRLTTIKEFRLGPFRFRNVPVYIFDDDYNVTSYPTLGGLIGNDILRRFNVIINYDRREIHLTPNSHYRDFFDYSYTGLGIYWIDEQIEVGDIMKESPAEKAGFKVGDILIAVNNNFSKDIQVYKNLFQNPGEKVKVIVRRNNELIQLTLKIRSIL